jgi:predicted RNase H-like HicB family nuclease
MQITDTLELSAVIRKENDFYVALFPEFDIASQGKNIEEALKNLKEAIELFRR